jgi:hypothetical protein
MKLMKLTTIALASVLALQSTFALAHGIHHRWYHHGHHGHHGTVGMSSARTGSGMSSARTGPNNRGGLVGGGDTGTYKP